MPLSDTDILTQARRVTLREQVAAELQRLVVSGVIAVGEALPSEAELSRMFHCGRGAVREALRGLEQSGMVARAPNGREMVVQPVGESKVSEALQLYIQLSQVTFKELFDVLGGLEHWIARHAAIEHDAAAIARLKALHARPIANLDELIEIEEEFHDLLAEATRNRLLIVLRAPVRAALHDAVVAIVPAIGPSALTGTVRAHGEILNAVLAGDGDAAASWALRHARALQRGQTALGTSPTDPVHPRVAPG